MLKTYTFNRTRWRVSLKIISVILVRRPSTEIEKNKLLSRPKSRGSRLRRLKER
ncbi:hypothetical protein COXBURSA334_0306 [Coxiella burnetii Q321]|nr:hypothetical protein COXBURSA334_0306 [Coxiella burnetii Q321]